MLCRQQLLKPGGLVLPSSAELCVVGIEDREHLVAKKQQWDNMAGLDMGAVMAQVCGSGLAVIGIWIL